MAGLGRGALLLACALLSMPLAAVEVPTLYTAEVPLDREAGDPRADAYDAALRQVLLRVSGSELANDEETVALLFPNPQAFVTQFRPGSDESLWVSFDGQAIEQVLRSAGQPLWGADRPLTLVWLAVDWGQGEREIIAADDPERMEQESRSIDRNRMIRQRLLEIADRRGLPLVFPLLDTTDLQSVTFADIWGGFDGAVLDASERYDADSVLIGRIRATSTQSNRWVYYFGDEEVALSGPPEAVLGQVADRLAAEFAIGGNLPLESVELAISGIVSVEAFGNVQRILEDVSIIERYAIVEVSGDRIRYDLDVRGGPERLGRALRFAGLLEQDFPDPSGPDAVLEFFYSP
jgi:hypothetical protein